ncbi:hypothetical protein D3C81_1863220 [compost metagenome]
MLWQLALGLGLQSRQCFGCQGRTEIRHQLRASFHLTGQHRPFANLRLCIEPGADFARLHAKTADLDLIVLTSQEHQVPTAIQANPVTTAIKALPLGSRAKYLRGQLRLTEVALGDLRACDQQLAGDTQRHRHVIAVDDTQMAIR